MESGVRVKTEERDSDETESDWFEYTRKSAEEILVYYNTKTGEYRWPEDPSGSENTILRDVPKQMCNVATQTEDYGCVNQCTSMYVDNERQMENKESESIEVKEELSDDDMIDVNEIKEEVNDDDTIDVNEQNTLNNTDVDDNLDEVSEDFGMVESLSTIVNDIKRRKELVQNEQPQHKRNTKIHNCIFCSKTFKKKSSHDSHLRTHTDEKPYQCSYCDKACAKKSNLRRHLQTHTDEKPFECSFCHKAFTVKSYLDLHLRTHTGEKPYECSHCDKAFSQQCNLRSHLRTHTGIKPYECSRCDKAFSQKGNLRSHLRSHTGERAFECSYCDKAYTRNSSLLVHLRSHTGEKPYD